MSKHTALLRLSTALAAIAVVALSSSPARAEFSWDDVLAIIAGQKLESWTGDRTEEQEKDAMALAYEAYYEKHGEAAVASAMIGGANLSHLPDGTGTELTFQFVSAGSKIPVDIPGLAKVRYEKQIEPPGLVPAFEVLGVAENPDCNYCMPFEVSGFEPLVKAVPLDALDLPIVVSGVNGSDVSVGVAINIDLSPPGVPDGSIGQPIRVAKLDGPDDALEISWDATTCPDVIDHQIVYGVGTTLPGAFGEVYGVTGAACAIGPASPFVWLDSPAPWNKGDDERLVWFLVLATDGSQTEGAWGLASDGLERTGPGVGGSSTQCGMSNKSLAYTCGNGHCDVDIRTTVRASRDDPPETQLNYDGINRSVHLFGQVPFERFLGSDLDALTPEFLDRLGTLASCTGLPTDEAAVAATYLDVAAAAAGMTVGEIMALLPGENPDLQTRISELRAHGIGFPKPAESLPEALDRIVAVAALVGDAGDRRYRDFYFLNEFDVTPAEFAAVELGKSSGALKMAICEPGLVCDSADAFGICDNDRCCSKGTGPVDTDECNVQEDSQCNLPPPSRAYCSIGSDACP